MYKKFSKIRHGSAIEGDVSVGRVLSPLPPIPSTKDASGESGEWKYPKDAETWLVGAIVQPELESKTSMFEIKRRMILLCVCDDHSCQNCLDDFYYIEFKILDYPKSVTQKLLENGFVEIFQHILGRFFETAVTEADNNASNACMSAMLSACSTVIIMTDVSSEACRKVIQLELHMDIINSLKSDHLVPKQTNQNLSSILCILVEKLIAILYNVVHHVTTEARELFRDPNIIEVIQRFKTGTTLSLSCLALMFIAWVLSDEENSTINTKDEVFSFLHKELRSSLGEVSHRSDCGYEAVKILTAINKFVLNDAKKGQIVKSRLLSSYVAFLEPRFDAEEQFLAAEGLWTLAFKCAEEIKKEKFCFERLELLLKTSEDDRVRFQVNGALIALGVKQENPIQASKLSSEEANS